MDATELEESFTFIQKPHDRSVEKKLSHARDILLNRVFLGCYGERRHVSQLNEYRDVITISSAESQLKTDLDAIVYELKEICDVKWVGITGAEVECSKPGSFLWVKLKNLPFGSFWFQIKQIKYENGEIILGLKCLREIKPQDYENAIKDVMPRSENSINSEELDKYAFDFDLVQKTTAIYAIVNDIIQQVKPHFTWNNFFLASKFIFTLAFVVTSFLLNFVANIGEYFLKVLKEVRLLLNAVAPIIVKVIDFFTKLSGGFLILIALIFRPHGAQQIEKEFQPLRNDALPPRQDPRRLMIRGE